MGKGNGIPGSSTFEGGKSLQLCGSQYKINPKKTSDCTRGNCDWTTNVGYGAQKEEGDSQRRDPDLKKQGKENYREKKNSGYAEVGNNRLGAGSSRTGDKNNLGHRTVGKKKM